MKPETVHTLNRLVVAIGRSLPMYLKWAKPNALVGEEATMAALEGIADNQQHMVDRIAEFIVDANELVMHGEFPMVFTGFHDLSCDYLIRESIRYQEHLLTTLQTAVGELEMAPAAQSLAQKAAGMAEGHLETLREIADGSHRGPHATAQ